MKIRNIRLSNVTITNRPVVGESVYTTTGTYTWVCPPEVYSVSVVCIGPGAVAPDGVAMNSPNGGNGYTPSIGGGAGSGGALAWKNNIPVTPGNVYYVYNGTFNYKYRGPGNFDPPMSGSAFRIENYSNGGARYAVAAGGADILAGAPLNSYRHSNFIVGEGGGLGGRSGIFGDPDIDGISPPHGYYGFYQGGGGAGGYTGKGGDGGRADFNYWEGANVGYGQPGFGGGGGGAGGGYDNVNPANSPAFTHLPAPLATIVAFGGGTGLYGQGDSGEGGSGTNLSANVLSPGGAGSGGMSHLYGGGIRVPNAYGITDSPGAVRIIWPGAIRKFPNTNTGEAGVVYNVN